MTVGFNISPLISGHQRRGMGLYASRLLNALKEIKEVGIEEFSNMAKIKEVDLVHHPFFDFFFTTLPIKKRFPTVVTVGDLTPLLFPAHYPPGIRGYLEQKIQIFSLRRAEAIITFSNSASDDIEKVLKINPRKIFPIYLAAANTFKVIKDSKSLATVKRKYDLPDRFALFVGSTNWNKNLLNLTESSLKSNTKIVFVGQAFNERNNLNHPELSSFVQFLSRYASNPNVSMIGFVEEEDLVKIYNLASMLLLPSFYEGFGLPILEAQACGCAVLTSNLSSMPEVGGKGAVYVDPYSVEDIIKGIRVIEENRAKLIKAGFENVKRFSWEKCAKETVEVYHYALEH